MPKSLRVLLAVVSGVAGFTVFAPLAFIAAMPIADVISAAAGAKLYLPNLIFSLIDLT